MSTISRVSAFCPNGDLVRIHFGDNYSSFDLDGGNMGDLRAIFSGQKRRNPNVSGEV